MGIEGGSNGALDLDWQQKGARRKSLLVTSTGCEAYVGGAAFRGSTTSVRVQTRISPPRRQ